MAKPNPLLLLLVLFLLPLFPSARSISEQELEAAISALRSTGYNLFGNAITTSDVRFELLLSNSSYTLFAPTDSTLFALDMALSAPAYVRTLRYHVALNRLPLSSLRSLPPASSLRTLLPHREVSISRRISPEFDFVTVDGVDVVFPGLFHGQDLAVHGLDGILSLRRPDFSGRTRSPSSTPDLRFPPSRSPDSRIPPSRSPDSGHLWSSSSDSPLPPTESLDSRLPPSGSADPPDLLLSSGYPTVDLSPMVHGTQSPSPDSEFAMTVPPSYLDGYDPPMQLGMGVEVPGGISPAVDGGREEEIPSEIVFPGANPPERILGPAAGGESTAEMGYSWNVGTCSSPHMECADVAAGKEGSGVVTGHRGRPRPRPVNDDSL